MRIVYIENYVIECWQLKFQIGSKLSVIRLTIHGRNCFGLVVTCVRKRTEFKEYISLIGNVNLDFLIEQLFPFQNSIIFIFLTETLAQIFSCIHIRFKKNSQLENDQPIGHNFLGSILSAGTEGSFGPLT